MKTLYTLCFVALVAACGNSPRSSELADQGAPLVIKGRFILDSKTLWKNASAMQMYRQLPYHYVDVRDILAGGNVKVDLTALGEVPNDPYTAHMRDLTLTMVQGRSGPRLQGEIPYQEWPLYVARRYLTIDFDTAKPNSITINFTETAIPNRTGYVWRNTQITGLLQRQKN